MDRGTAAELQIIRPTRATIDLDALDHNLREVRRTIGQALVMGVVKANAYGHGARLVGPALERHGIDWLGVALVEEGLELRAAGVTVPILLLDGAYGDAYDLLLAQRLTPLVFRQDHLTALAAAAKRLSQPADAHLKVDTGMGRLGVAPEDVASFAAAAMAAGVRLTGLCTHFANADLGDPAMTRLQLSRFAEAEGAVRAAGHRPTLVHLSNSAASVSLPAAHRTLVRPGLMLYGVAPAPRFAEGLNLRPVLRWTTRVLLIKRVPSQTPISYGGRFVTSRPSVLAVLPVGYADGYRRGLTGQAEVLLHGRRAPVVGVITMDLCITDVTDIPGVALDDEAVLLGEQGDQRISAEELAQRSDTIPYEILCGIGGRVPRVAIGSVA